MPCWCSMCGIIWGCIIMVGMGSGTMGSTMMLEHLVQGRICKPSIGERKLPQSTFNPQHASAVFFALAKPVAPRSCTRGWRMRRRFLRALRPGGRLVVVESTLEAEVGPPVEMRIGPEVVERELVGAGFRVEVVRGGLPRHYLVIGRKDVSSKAVFQTM